MLQIFGGILEEIYKKSLDAGSKGKLVLDIKG